MDIYLIQWILIIIFRKKWKMGIKFRINSENIKINFL